ncbi:tRNA (guanine-N(7)-)-methyltransferase non-catalytic subunit WDR4-like [Dysidea avara]|uniref:tRNA (guanine-N(7)-)-methyltransferase non-catalytic subunit WDR4-like n=1 Tax=Dysidea avara TaxID=196820 RepID=UPI00331C7C5E
MNCCPLSDWVGFTTAQSNVLLMNKSNDEMKILECGNDHVVCIKCSQSRKLFATCSNSKVLKIWDTSSFQCCGTRVVSKSVTAICFTQDDSLILVADKTGDVHSYSTDDIGKESTFLLGHLSMLLDMLIVMRKSGSVIFLMLITLKHIVLDTLRYYIRCMEKKLKTLFC